MKLHTALDSSIALPLRQPELNPKLESVRENKLTELTRGAIASREWIVDMKTDLNKTSQIAILRGSDSFSYAYPAEVIRWL